MTMPALLFSPWSRVGAVPLTFPAGAILTALSRGAGRLDLFGAASDGGIWFTRFDDAARGSGWDAWRRVGGAAGLNSPPDLGPTAVARGETVDLFCISSDGGIWTTSGDPVGGFTPDWRPVGRLTAFAPGTALTALAADADHASLFAVGADGGVWAIAWDSSLDWADWQRVGDAGLVDPYRRQRAAALPRAGGAELFIIDREGHVVTATGDDGRPWSAWSPVDVRATFAPGSQVTALSLGGGGAALVAPDRDGGVWLAAREQPGPFGPFARVGDAGLLATPPRTAVTALARGTAGIALFVTGHDGVVYSATGASARDLGAFAPLGGLPGPVPAQAIIAAASSRPDRVDLFVVRSDGSAHGSSVRAGTPAVTAVTTAPAAPPASGTPVATPRDAPAPGGELAQLAELDALRGTSDGVARRRALLVGVNVYVDPNMPALHFCVNDVLALRDTLLKAGYASVVTLSDDAPELYFRPTLENIKVELLDFAASLAPDDLALVHFSCHGALIGGKPHLLPANVRTRILDETALAVDEVTRILGTSAARCIIVLLDACHSGADLGRGASGSGLTPEFVHNVYELARGMKVLAGATAQQVAEERADAARGVFTSFVVEALGRVDGWSPADHEHKGFVSFDDLRNHVANGVMDWTRVHKYDIQRPNENGAGAGSMIVADFR
jgi:hypothetical protein